MVFRRPTQVALLLLAAGVLSLPADLAAVNTPRQTFDARPIDLLNARSEGFSCLAMSPDGKTLATGVFGGETGEVKLWDLPSRKVIATYRDAGTSPAIAFSADGRLLALVAAEGAVIVRDRARDEVVGVIRGHRGGATSLLFTPDSRTLITRGNDLTIKLWDAATLQETRELPNYTHGVQDWVLFPDGKRLLACSQSVARVWDLVADAEKLVLRGHRNGIMCVAISPDGETLATSGLDRILKLWDARTGQELDSFEVERFCNGLCFSPDGKILVSRGQDGYLQFWDVARSSELGVVEASKGGVMGAAFTPDSKTLITSSTDRTIKLWDVATRKETAALREPSSDGGLAPMMLAVAYSPDGATLVTAGDDKQLHVWDRATRRRKGTLRGHEDVIADVAFAPDGKTVASASHDQTIRLWDVGTGAGPMTPRALLAGHSNWVQCIAFSADGRTLASGGFDKKIRLWDVASGKEVGVLTGHSAGVRSVAFSPDGKSLASGSGDRTVRLWDLGTRAETARWKEHDGAVRSVRFAPDGKTLASGSEDGSIILWNVVEGKARLTLDNGRAVEATVTPAVDATEVWAVAFTPDGGTLVSAGFGPPRLWDTTSGALLRALAGHTDRVTCVAVAADGGELASGSLDRTVKLWPASTPRWQARSALPGKARFAAISPDGSRVLSGDNSAPRLHATELGRAVGTLQGGSAVAHDIAFSADGKQAVVAYDDHTLKIWDVPSRTIVRTLTGHRAAVRSAAFSPDGGSLVSSGGDFTRRGEPGELKVWKLASGTEPRTLAGHKGLVYRAVYSPDGKWIASASEDQTVKIWQASGEQAIATLRGHKRGVRHVAFSPDGKRLASAGFDGKLHIWDSGSWRLVATLSLEKRVFNAVAFFPDSRRIAACHNDERGLDGAATYDPGQVNVWDWETGKEVATLKGHAATVLSVAVSGDGRWLCTAGGAMNRYAEVKLWDADSWSEARALKGPINWAEAAAFSADSRTLAASGGDESAGPGAMHLWEVPASAPMLGLGSAAAAAGACSPDGKWLAVAGSDHVVTIWDVAARMPVHSLRRHGAVVRCAAFSPDSVTLATASDDRTIVLWDARTGRERGVLRGHSRGVCSLSFSVAGKTLVSCSGDGTNERLPGEVKMWDVATGKEGYTLPGAGRDIRTLTFSPDGRWLAGRSHLGHVYVWDAVTGTEQAVLSSRSVARALAFTPDSTRLVTGNDDGRLHVWDTSKWKEQPSHAEASAPPLVFSNGIPVAPRLGSVLYPTVKGPITAVTVSADARTVLTVRDNGEVTLWDIPRQAHAQIGTRDWKRP